VFLAYPMIIKVEMFMSWIMAYQLTQQIHIGQSMWLLKKSK